MATALCVLVIPGRRVTVQSFTPQWKSKDIWSCWKFHSGLTCQIYSPRTKAEKRNNIGINLGLTTKFSLRAHFWYMMLQLAHNCNIIYFCVFTWGFCDREKKNKSQTHHNAGAWAEAWLGIMLSCPAWPCRQPAGGLRACFNPRAIDLSVSAPKLRPFDWKVRWEGFGWRPEAFSTSQR